jgi:hypothetical protein
MGVVFHAWRSLRFQNAIWHAFILVAACCHYSAVLVCVARGEIELKSVSFGAIDRERGSGANLDPRRWAKNALHYAAQRTEHR